MEAETAAGKPQLSYVRRPSEKVLLEIVGAARAYISKNGLRDLNVERLMRDTRTARSSFYVYFTSIDELAAVFVLEISAKIGAVSSGWYQAEGDPRSQIRETLRGAVEIWPANGPMIRALEEASWRNDRLRTVFRDEIGLRPITLTTDVILRDQAKGWIGPMDAREMAVALNRFNMTYLNDRFGNPRRKSKTLDKEMALEILYQVWTGTLYGGGDSGA